MMIRISRVHFPVTALGPGRRLGIWFQGCGIRCKGCLSIDTWGEGAACTVDAVFGRLESWIGEAEGITVTGGEPFDQPDALTALLKELKCRTTADILVYSGYPVEKLASHPGLSDGTIDALISDPFDARAQQTLALRGSDNQRLHLLTPLGKRRFACYNREQTEKRALDIMFDEDGTIWMAGIPARDDLMRLDKWLRRPEQDVLTGALSTNGKAGSAPE